jgi:hypothetical protein
MKQIAREMGMGYGPIRMAILGHTWSSVANPPPLTAGELETLRRRRLRRTCGNCGRVYRAYHQDRCGACYTFRRKYGKERNGRDLHKHPHTRLSRSQVAALYQRYLEAGCIEKVAEGQPFSAETLRRRFHQDGYEVKPGYRLRLSAGQVRYARRRHYEDGEQISQLADEMGLNYSTLYSAVVGHTWAHAGNLPANREREGRPCAGCKMLTGHTSGLCVYCRRSE